MAINYTPLTDFLTKDTLPKEDPDKVILGADFDAEFNAISTAFSGAAPTNNPVFTGTATFDGVTVNTVTIGSATLGSLDISGNATVGGTLSVNGTVTSGGSELTTLDDVTSLIATAELGSIARLEDLSDVSVDSVVDGQSIIWNDANEEWQASTPALSTLSDVDVTGIEDGSFLGYDAGNSEWVPTAIPASTSITAVASGALTKDTGVVLNEDSTASQVSQDTRASVTGDAVAYGPVGASGIPHQACVYDPGAQRLLVAYNDESASGHGKLTLGTEANVNNAPGFTFGGVVTFNSNGYTSEIRAVYDASSGKCVIVYRDNTIGDLKAVVVTITGDTISLGTPVTFAAEGSEIAACADSTNGGIAVAWKQNFPTGSGFVKFGQVSGTSITFGVATAFTTGATEALSVGHDPSTNSILVVRRQDNNSLYVSASAARLVGTAYEFGQMATLASNITQSSSIVYDPIQSLFYVAYQNNNDHPTIRIVRVNDSGVNREVSVDWSEVVSANAMVDYELAWDEEAQNAVLNMRTEGNFQIYASNFRKNPLSNNLTDVANRQVYGNGENASICSWEADGGVVFIYSDRVTDGGKCAVVQVSYSRYNLSERFVGFADADYTDGQTATIQTMGSLVELPSSLLDDPLDPGRTCNIKRTGKVGNGAPNSAEELAGQAVTPSSIIVKGTA
jgi:hypothetical protein